MVSMKTSLLLSVSKPYKELSRFWQFGRLIDDWVMVLLSKLSKCMLLSIFEKYVLSSTFEKLEFSLEVLV